jgi:hypothetical protein
MALLSKLPACSDPDELGMAFAWARQAFRRIVTGEWLDASALRGRFARRTLRVSSAFSGILTPELATNMFAAAVTNTPTPSAFVDPLCFHLGAQ